MNASDSSAALGITMALLRPYEVMKMGCCLPGWELYMSSVPSPAPGPMDTPASAGKTKDVVVVPHPDAVPMVG